MWIDPGPPTQLRPQNAKRKKEEDRLGPPTSRKMVLFSLIGPSEDAKRVHRRYGPLKDGSLWHASTF